MTPEGKVKTQIKRVLDTLPRCWYFMPQAGIYGKRGIPDFVGTIDGKFFAIEAKSHTGKTTPLQDLTHIEIRAAGGAVAVCRSGAEAIEFLKML